MKDKDNEMKEMDWKLGFTIESNGTTHGTRILKEYKELKYCIAKNGASVISPESKEA